MRKPFKVEGYLQMSHNDDCGPVIEINGQLLTVLLADHFRTCTCCDLHAGYVRLTIAFLEDPPHA